LTVCCTDTRKRCSISSRRWTTRSGWPLGARCGRSRGACTTCSRRPSSRSQPDPAPSIQAHNEVKPCPLRRRQLDAAGGSRDPRARTGQGGCVLPPLIGSPGGPWTHSWLRMRCCAVPALRRVGGRDAGPSSLQILERTGRPRSARLHLRSAAPPRWPRRRRLAARREARPRPIPVPVGQATVHVSPPSPPIVTVRRVWVLLAEAKVPKSWCLRTCSEYRTDMRDWLT
jgi:hypothetical protein